MSSATATSFAQSATLGLAQLERKREIAALQHEADVGLGLVAGESSRTVIAKVKPYNEELHAQFIALKDKNDWKLKFIARMLRQANKKLNVSEGSLSKYISGKPVGKVEELEAAIAVLVANETHRHYDVLEVGQLIETGFTRLFATMCEEAREVPGYFVAVIGDNGIGKSSAIALYRNREDKMALTLDLDYVSGGGGRNALEKVFLKYSTGDKNGPRDRHTETVGEFIVRSFTALRRLIIIDNAQDLTTGGIKWLMGFQDKTRCPVILIGDPDLHETLAKVRRAPSRVILMEQEAAITSKTLSARTIARNFLETNWPDAVDELTEPAAEILTQPGHIRTLNGLVLKAREWSRKRPETCSTPLKAFNAVKAKCLVHLLRK